LTAKVSGDSTTASLTSSMGISCAVGSPGAKETRPEVAVSSSGAMALTSAVETVTATVRPLGDERLTSTSTGEARS